ncbi:RTA1 like protein-domain-containing protein [Mycena filopes]|nr:RTA1 like protein-domain-containing protein [Mycena filopes]
MPRFGRLILLALLSATVTVLAADDQSTTKDDRPIGGFVPKKAPAVFALALYAISTAIHWTHFFAASPRRPFMATLPLGMTCKYSWSYFELCSPTVPVMATGFVLRILYSNPPFTLGKYIAMDLFILLAPCLFLATDYMILSHLATTFDEKVTDRCLLIRHSRIVKIFVWSDVSTFFLQSAGGGMSTSNPTLGNTIALTGLVVQALSFLFFSIVLAVFGLRVKKYFPDAWHAPGMRPFQVLSREPIGDWRVVFYIMGVTCIGILIRSVFRLVEYAGGFSGVVATHEGYFYFFDALPLWLSMTLYCVVWPAQALIPRQGHEQLSMARKPLV